MSKEVTRTINTEKKKGKKKKQVNISVTPETKKEFTKLKLKGHSADSTLKVLMNVFKDPSLKKIYNIQAISQEYYNRALEQRRISRVKFEEENGIDTGTRAYDENRYLKFKERTPFFSIATKKETKKKRYFNRIWLTFSDYDLETMAHMQFLTGISRPQEILLHCLRTCYLLYSQDRLFRNTNAELAERNIHKMIEDSLVDERAFIPIHNDNFPTEHRKIMETLKIRFNVSTQRDVLRTLVRKEYEKHKEERKKNPKWYDLVGTDIEKDLKGE